MIHLCGVMLDEASAAPGMIYIAHSTWTLASIHISHILRNARGLLDQVRHFAIEKVGILQAWIVHYRRPPFLCHGIVFGIFFSRCD